MPTTTNFGWTTPADTDLVKDGAAAIRTLAGNIDTSLVDLKGGTTGQVLAKASGTDLDFTFTTISGTPTTDSATVATTQTTTSSTYTDLTTAGPAVTITTGTKALVIVTARANISIAGESAFFSYAVSGATTIAAADTVGAQANFGAGTNGRFSAVSRLTTLTAGSNTFTMKYRRGAGTGEYSDREIFVMDLGS